MKPAEIVMGIDRQSGVQPYSLGAAVTATGVMPTSGGAMGSLFIDPAWDGGLTFTWDARPDPGAAWSPIVDPTGADITSTVVAGSACEIPAGVMIHNEIRAKFSVTTLAQVLFLAVKG